MKVPKIDGNGNARIVVLFALVCATLAVLGLGLVLVLSYSPVAGIELAPLTIGVAAVGVSGIAFILHFVWRDHRRQAEEGQSEIAAIGDGIDGGSRGRRGEHVAYDFNGGRTLGRVLNFELNDRCPLMGALRPQAGLRIRTESDPQLTFRRER
jgi:membrane protein implicated in regulation of membrane protease activity